MKYISTLIALILFSFISTAQNSKNIPKLYHKKLFNSIAGRYANVDVTMGYAKGTGSIIIGNPNQSKYSLFNDFSFLIYVLRGQDQQFGSITNITTESNDLNDFLIRFDWKNKRTDQGTISGEIQLFYSLSKDKYETYFINNSSSIFKIFWWTELDQSQKDSLNSIINILYKQELVSILSNSAKPIDIKELYQLKIENERKEEKLKEDLILIQKKEQQSLLDRNKAELLQKIKDDELRKIKIDSFQKVLTDLKYYKSIIGIPITINNLIIAQNDFPERMNWEDAKKACQSLGNGWRMPSKDELKILYKNFNKIGGFDFVGYWSSTESGSEDARVSYFNDGFFAGHTSSPKRFQYKVRAVKDL